MARLFFIGMWNFCDDGGVIRNKPISLKMKIFPGDPITKEDIEGYVSELCEQGLIVQFENKGQEYLQVTGWDDHQRIDKPTFKYPRAFDEGSKIIRGAFDERSPPEGNGREGKGEEGSKHSRKTSVPKNFAVSESVKKWAEKKGFTRLDEHLEAFVCKAEAKGYKYVDWDKAFMNAVRDDWAGLRKGGKTPRLPKDFRMAWEILDACGLSCDGSRDEQQKRLDQFLADNPSERGRVEGML